METILKQNIQNQLKQNMPKSYLSLIDDIKNFLEGKITIVGIKKEVYRLLIEMEISTNNASSYEINQVKKEIKYMLEILGI